MKAFLITSKTLSKSKYMYLGSQYDWLNLKKVGKLETLLSNLHNNKLENLLGQDETGVLGGHYFSR